MLTKFKIARNVACNETVPSIPSKTRVVDLNVIKKNLGNLEVLSVSQELLSLAFHEAKYIFWAKTITDSQLYTTYHVMEIILVTKCFIILWNHVVSYIFSTSGY